MRELCDNYLKQTGYYNMFFRKFPREIRKRIILLSVMNALFILWIAGLYSYCDYFKIIWGIYDFLIFVLPVIVILFPSLIMLKNLNWRHRDIIMSQSIDKRIVKKSTCHAIQRLRKIMVLRLIKKHGQLNEKTLDLFIEENESRSQNEIVRFSFLEIAPIALIFSFIALLISMANLFLVVEKITAKPTELWTLSRILVPTFILLYVPYKGIKWMVLDFWNRKSVRIQGLVDILKEIKVDLLKRPTFI